MSQFPSASALPPDSREAVCTALQAVVVDGIDLYTQLKVAHWNVKGEFFLAVHPLFDSLASEVIGFNDMVAERILQLGTLAKGTARHVAANSSLDEYPQDLVCDCEHVLQVTARIQGYVNTVSKALKVALKEDDQGTANLLIDVASAFEKQLWFLLSSVEQPESNDSDTADSKQPARLMMNLLKSHQGK